MTASKPNKTATDAAYRLEAIHAPNLTAADEHLLRELSLADGYGERGESVSVTSSAEMTPTEAAANARYELNAMRDELRAALQEAVDGIDRLGWVIQRAMRLRAPKGVPAANAAKLCRDGLTDASRPGAVEWHDPTCTAGAVSRGLCRKHYNAMYYWRSTHGLEPLPEQDPMPVLGVIRSHREIITHDGQLGVVHVSYQRVG